MQKKNSRVSVAVVGLGGWGKKLVSTTIQLGINVHGYDIDNTKTRALKQAFPTLTTHSSLQHILKDPMINAVIIATTPSTHYALAKVALLAGKHVLVEKPLTQNVRHAKELASIAFRIHRVLMVDHTYIFSAAIAAARKEITSGRIGKLERMEAIRTNSRPLSDSDVLWDFASHDAAIALFFLKNNPISVQTIASPYVKGYALDDASIVLEFSEHIRYLAHLSWTDPVKERMLTFVGDKGALTIGWEGKKETLTHYTNGRKAILKTPPIAPLKIMLTDFMNCIKNDTSPISGAALGIQVIKITAALHRSWEKRGKLITRI